MMSCCVLRLVPHVSVKRDEKVAFLQLSTVSATLVMNVFVFGTAHEHVKDTQL